MFYRLIFKRFLDIGVSVIALIILSPLFLVITILLLLTGEHTVFYLQDRVGYKNNFFRIIKFATMLKNSPNMGTGSLTVRNDPRVTSVGRFLRKSKINELPQLFNVLFGSMSLVGPRPQMEVDFLKFPIHIQKTIYDVKPGITGTGSIVFRDEEKLLSNTNMDPHEYYKQVIAPYKGELEVWYIKNCNLKIDFILILLTVFVILYPEKDLHNKWLKTLPVANFKI